LAARAAELLCLPRGYGTGLEPVVDALRQQRFDEREGESHHAVGSDDAGQFFKGEPFPERR
jgi:hypothetical protein